MEGMRRRIAGLLPIVFSLASCLATGPASLDHEPFGPDATAPLPFPQGMQRELEDLATRGLLPGRPRILDGTVVTAAGQLIRGGHIQIDAHARASTVGSAHFTAFKAAGADLVRLTYDGNGEGSLRPALSLDRAIELLDRAVLEAGRVGLIVKLEYARHSPGTTPDSGDIRRFWEAVAPRYAEFTHVCYGIANEPVAWEPDDYRDSDIALQEELYKLIRAKAPETLLMLMGFSSVDDTVIDCMEKVGFVDWSNACVDFHAYGPLEERSPWWLALKARWPVFCGEFTHAPWAGQHLPPGDIARALEDLGISWNALCFDGTSVLEYMGPR